jgi:hypothetical protein
VVAQSHFIQSVQFQVPDSGTDSTGSPNRASSLNEMKPICLTYHQPTGRSRAIASMRKSIHSIGQSVISQKKAEILTTTEIGGKGRVEKRNIQGRDLLSLLIKANVATDIPDSARMTDEDILARESKSGNDAFNGNTDDDAFRRGSNLHACRL